MIKTDYQKRSDEKIPIISNSQHTIQMLDFSQMTEKGIWILQNNADSKKDNCNQIKPNNKTIFINEYIDRLNEIITP